MTSTAEPRVMVLPDPPTLVAAAAARLITRLCDVQAERDYAHVVLTGGGTGIDTLAALLASPARGAVDFTKVDFWWGDERFVPSSDPDRNALQADDALLAHLDLDPARVHRMPATDGPDGDNVEAAAARYATELAQYASPSATVPVPSFDVLMLGLGPDGHVASLFPGLPGVEVRGATSIAVHDSPKPPPTRISLTVEAIQAAKAVWVIAAGANKAEVAARAIGGDQSLPSALARGTQETLWMLDESAAAQLA